MAIKSCYEDIAIVMIVENEEDNIDSKLRQFIKKGFVNFFILDTGSKDMTIQKIIVLFDLFPKLNLYMRQILRNSHGDDAKVRFDYSIYRNLSLDLADELLPQCSFCIFIDVECYPRSPETFEYEYVLLKNNDKILANIRIIRLHYYVKNDIARFISDPFESPFYQKSTLLLGDSPVSKSTLKYINSHEIKEKEKLKIISFNFWRHYAKNKQERKVNKSYNQIHVIPRFVEEGYGYIF